MPAVAAIGPALKALMASKYFWPALITGGFLGQTALEEAGKVGERGIAREELGLQKQVGESRIAASKKELAESRRRAKEYTESLLKLRKEETKRSREQELMQFFMASQDRQMALLMQAVQGLSQQRPQYSASGGGMLGLMRS